MKKGFTLIELLAVIVILAVIAIIVTPVLTGIITKAKLSADMRSAEGYVKAAEDYFIDAQINEEKKNKIGTNISNDIEISGAKPNGELIINSKGQVSMAVVINNRCYMKTNDSNKIRISDDVSSCTMIVYVVPPDRCFDALDNDDGTVSITNYKCGDSVTYNDSDKTLIFNDDGEYRNIILPSSINGKNIKMIYAGSFSPYNISKFMVDDTKKVGINSIIISENVINIDAFSFYYNHMVSVNLPNTLTTIGMLAFGCNKLTDIEIPDSVIEIESGAFTNNQLTSVKLSKKLTKINDSVFMDNKINSIDLLNVTSLGTLSLSNNKLTQIYNYDSVIDMGIGSFNGNELDDEHAFIYAQKDNNGNGKIDANEIDKKTLKGYAGAKKDNVEIPATVTSIEDNGLIYAEINSIIIPNTVTNLGSNSLSNNNFISIEIPSSITTLNTNLLSNNPFLVNVTIPNSVTNMYTGIFESDSSLTEINLPVNLNSIAAGCFKNTGIETINIPNSVTYLSPYAFEGMNKLKTINIDKNSNSISYAPWSAPDGTNINWLR